MLRAVLPTLAFAATVFAGAARAEPIYLRPGQCILVGSQQVCAMQSDQSGDLGKGQTLYVCRYGVQPGSEIPDLKSYALFQVRVRDVGGKTETLVKNYGPNDKDVCEKEAEKREAAAKGG